MQRSRSASPRSNPNVPDDVLRQVAADAAADAGGVDQDLLGDFLTVLTGAVAA
ncbi:MAG: hypothetical protein ACRDWT_16540 [Jatrophihabitantaceae bacterium]